MTTATEIYLQQRVLVRTANGEQVGRIEELSTGSRGERIGVRLGSEEFAWFARHEVRVEVPPARNTHTEMTR